MKKTKYTDEQIEKPTSQWTIMDVDEDCNRVKVLFWFDEEESIKEEEAVK